MHPAYRSSSRRGLLAIAASIASLGGSLLLLAACPGSLENPEQFTTGTSGGCGDVEQTIIAQRCATASCHDAGTSAGSLNMTPDAGLASRLVGVASPTCATAQLVNPDAPEESTVYTKCLQTNPCGGLRMPASGAKLTTEEEACLLEWVSSL